MNMTQKRKYTKRSSGKRAKTKGNSFENTVAKLLSAWADTEFHRVPLSGGWRSTNVATGDIFLVEEYATDCVRDKPRVHFPFSVECKNQERWDLATLFKPEADRNIIGKFWAQATDDAKINQKVPALIFTRNFQPIFFMIRLSTAKKLGKLMGTSYESLSHMIHTMPNKDKIVILTFTDFLAWVPFETVLKLDE